MKGTNKLLVNASLVVSYYFNAMPITIIGARIIDRPSAI